MDEILTIDDNEVNELFINIKEFLLELEKKNLELI